MIYRDLSVEEQLKDLHPAIQLDKESPCFAMRRSAIDGKSVFHFNEEQARAIYKWYVTDYHYGDVVDEFGDKIPSYDFKEILKKSYYWVDQYDCPSEETTEELCSTTEVENEL